MKKQGSTALPGIIFILLIRCDKHGVSCNQTAADGAGFQVADVVVKQHWRRSIDHFRLAIRGGKRLDCIAAVFVLHLETNPLRTRSRNVGVIQRRSAGINRCSFAAAR